MMASRNVIAREYWGFIQNFISRECWDMASRFHALRGDVGKLLILQSDLADAKKEFQIATDQMKACNDFLHKVSILPNAGATNYSSQRLKISVKMTKLADKVSMLTHEITEQAAVIVAAVDAELSRRAKDKSISALVDKKIRDTTLLRKYRVAVKSQSRMMQFCASRSVKVITYLSDLLADELVEEVRREGN